MWLAMRDAGGRSLASMRRALDRGCRRGSCSFLRSFGIGFAVFIVTAPPDVGFGAWTAVGGVFPFFLSAEGCEVEEGPDVEAFDAAAVGEVGAEDFVLVVADEDAEAVGFIFVGGEAEVLVEVGVFGGVPGEGPAHAFLEFFDVGERGEGDHAEGDVAGVEVVGGTELIGDHGAADASGIGPAADGRGEHEVVEDELAAAFEEIEEGCFAVGAVEGVLFFDAGHGEAAAFGGEDVAGVGGGFFFDEEGIARRAPFGFTDDFRKIDCAFGLGTHGWIPLC